MTGCPRCKELEREITQLRRSRLGRTSLPSRIKREVMRAITIDGVSQRKASRKYGISQSTISRWCKQAGVSTWHTKFRCDNPEKARPQLIADVKAGRRTLRGACISYDVNYITGRKWCREAGVLSRYQQELLARKGAHAGVEEKVTV